MNKNKRAQFFLLAAVIISVIVISLGVSTNKVIVKDEPASFYDFTYEVEREIGETFNYEVYRDIEGDGTLEEFVSLMSEEINDDDPDSAFVFIFGNDEELTVSNTGEDAIEIITGDFEDVDLSSENVYYRFFDIDDFGYVTTDNIEDCYNYADVCEYCVLGTLGLYCATVYFVPGASEEIEGNVCVGIGCNPMDSDASEYDSSAGTLVLEGVLDGVEEITISVDGSKVAIPVSEYSQVYLIAKKTTDDESYFSIN